ncbi:hypothetical protein ACJX0J_007829 [Zea mays]
MLHTPLTTSLCHSKLLNWDISSLTVVVALDIEHANFFLPRDFIGWKIHMFSFRNQILLMIVKDYKGQGQALPCLLLSRSSCCQIFYYNNNKVFYVIKCFGLICPLLYVGMGLCKKWMMGRSHFPTYINVERERQLDRFGFYLFQIFRKKNITS